MPSKIVTSVVVAAATCALLPGMVPAASAKPAASGKAGGAPKGASAASTPRKAPLSKGAKAAQVAAMRDSAALTYENLRVALTPVSIQSANDVLSRTGELAGRAVEMQGVVCGIMSNATNASLPAGTPNVEGVNPISAAGASLPESKSSKVCLLQLADAIVPLNVPDTVDTKMLRAKATLRVIALVNEGPTAGTFTILALTDTLAPVSTSQPTITLNDTTGFGAPSATMIPQGAPSVMGRTVTVKPQPATSGGSVYMQRPTPGGDNLVLQGNGVGAGDDIIVVPPMTEATLPAPDKAVAQAAPRRNAPIRPQTPQVGDVTSIDAQVPSYKALVLRHNPRLRDDQAEEIAEALLRHGYAQNIDPRFLAAVVCVESGFNPYAVSRSGAMGLGQIMPFNLRGLGIQNAWDSSENIKGCALMLRRLLDQFTGRPDSTLLAVAAYNAGPNAVVRAGYQVPGGSQVQGYVWKVYNRYKAYAPDMF